MSEDDDEDWFERALGETGEAEGEGEESETEAGEPEAEKEQAEEGEPEAEKEQAEEGEPEAEKGQAEEDEPEAEKEQAEAGEADEREAEEGEAEEWESPPSEEEESPFGEDFASAFQNAPEPEGGFGAGPGPETGGAPGPGPGSGGGGAEAGGFGEPGPEGGFGGEGGPPGVESFEDEEFESAIERVDLGIEGLDEMILGGVPKRSLISIIGSAGTGKTTFGLQFLNQALSNGKRGVYLTLEESTDRIFDTAEEKGWPFEQYEAEGRLAVVHLDPIEMANSLASIRSDLPELVDEFDADRLVLDSVSLLEMMYDHPSDRRSEVYQFTRSLKESGVTTLVTSEADNDNPYSSRYGIIEYLADAVFVLQYVRPSNFQETRLAVEIQKIRDANHSRETKPYEITNEGISVYRQANIF